MTVEEKVKKYFKDERYAIEAICNVTGVHRSRVIEVIAMMPEEVLENLGDNRPWYYVNNGFVAKSDDKSLSLNSVRKWVWQGTEFITGIDCKQELRIIPVYVCPHVLKFVADNIDNIESLILPPHRLVYGLFVTIHTDWNQLGICDKAGTKFRFVNGVPMPFCFELEDTQKILERGWTGSGIRVGITSKGRSSLGGMNLFRED